MRRRHTRLVQADPQGIALAAEVLREGGLVAFPTETVYGLGANAFDAEAAAGIFIAKGRPADDPLIVHIARDRDFGRVARRVPAAARALARAFWPGPLSMVLPKREAVPPIVTAGLETVAVRMPAHPVARALIEAAGVPVAAPSANLFSRPSPTRAEHVADDLGGRIDLIVDGGPTNYGVESTIVDMSGVPYRLLRPGGLPSEAIESILGAPLAVPPRTSVAGPQLSPGLLDTHYAPRTPLVVVEGDPGRARLVLRQEVERALEAGQRCGALLVEEDRDLVPAGVLTLVLGSWSEPGVSAERLFDALRSLDRAHLDTLFARQLAEPGRGLGRALADRLARAAGRRVQARAEPD
jgi:L-threonylcarbamoyladenylate synthase